MQIETEQKEARALTFNGVLSPISVSGEIMDIFLKIERAWAICNDVYMDYFGYGEEYYQKHPWLLMSNYEKTRIFVDVVTEYLYDSKIMLDRLRERIDEVPEVSSENKDVKEDLSGMVVEVMEQ